MFRSTRLRTAVSMASAAIFALTAPTATAATRIPAITHFDISAQQQPENIAVAPDGSAYVTFYPRAQIARVSPEGRVRIVATLPAGGTVSGIVLAPDGGLYVNYRGGQQTGVWRVTPAGTSHLFAALPPDGFPNGLAIAGTTLYTTDSSAGEVWRVPLDGSGAVRWARGGPLAKTSAYGANGIKTGQGSVWVSNTDTGTLVRIPVKRDGTAGDMQVKATGLTRIDDFSFDGKNVLAALNSGSMVALVHPDGSHTIVLTAGDGLSNPTSVAVSGWRVYVTSSANTTRQDPNLLTIDRKSLERRQVGVE